jgi:hypothetical protein
MSEALLEGERSEIVRALIEGAKAGDPTALRLCTERLIPLRKGRIVEFPLPPIKTASDIVAGIGAVVIAMSKGVLTPDEAMAIADVIETSRKAWETCNLADEVRELKAHFGAMGRL